MHTSIKKGGMTMSSKGILTLALAAAGTVAACAAVIGTTLTADPSTTLDTTTVTTAAVYRTIGEWEGQVAVFAPYSDTPETVYDAVLSSLPAEEQEKLRRGIDVASSTELKQRLEDYLS